MHKTRSYLFLRFLKIGATSWGGYMALIAMIEKQFCERDKSFEEEKLMQAISLASVLPGPVAVNVVAYLGYQLQGIKGALISMFAVLLPCFILMTGLSYVYFAYGNVPVFTNFFTGITPAVAALLASVVFSMWRKNVKDVWQVLIAIAALAAILFVHAAYITILVIFFAAFFGYVLYKKTIAIPLENNNGKITLPSSKKLYRQALIIAAILLLLIVLYYVLNQFPSVHLYKQMLFTFSGLSISQFGGGYVVIPSMQKVVVDGLHWLTNKEFTDAIAMGQVTPGPIYISAAFIGYKLAGITGAVMCTLAMFFPAACIMLICARFMHAITDSPVVKACFKGITAAVTGMIAAAACNVLYKAAAPSIILIIIFIISFLLFTRFKLSPVYVIPLAGLTGLFILK